MMFTAPLNDSTSQPSEISRIISAVHVPCKLSSDGENRTDRLTFCSAAEEAAAKERNKAAPIDLISQRTARDRKIGVIKGMIVPANKSLPARLPKSRTKSIKSLRQFVSLDSEYLLELAMESRIPPRLSLGHHAIDFASNDNGYEEVRLFYSANQLSRAKRHADNRLQFHASSSILHQNT
jgi:hypothetical protein